METKTPDAVLADLLGAIANPTRLWLLRRLQRPAFIPDLTKEFGLTRQALKKHLDELVQAGIVTATVRRRGALPASQYATSATGFFALREMVSDLGLSEGTALVSRPTMLADPQASARRHQGPGLLMVHGDLAGRWFPLAAQPTWVIGRDPKADIPLAYDGYASNRHAMLQGDGTLWRLIDLHSTNGTRVNFARIGRGASVTLAQGDIVTVGRTHLALRAER